jgi:epoxide hydrolase 4
VNVILRTSVCGQGRVSSVSLPLTRSGCFLWRARHTLARMLDHPHFREEYVTATGLRLHCVAAGNGGLMLFLHGFPEFWYEWKEQLREFGRDHLAVAPDLRGYNLSDKPGGLEQYRVEVLLEDIRGLADHFRGGHKFDLVGHDWGGALAWAFAITHPERVRKLVIVNAPHPAIFTRLLAANAEQQSASQYMLLFRSAGAEAFLSAGNYAALVEAVLGDLLRRGTFTEKDKEAYLQAWSQPGALTGGLNYYRANQVGPPVPAEMAGEIGASQGLAADPAQWVVRVPTLVIWGEKDIALTTHNLEGLDKFVPDLTVKRIPDGSHWVIHEKPAEVNRYIREFVG